jgi:hypothetical protein
VLDFEIQRCTRRCAQSDRELAPGEVFYSALVAEGADVTRFDFAEKEWSEPPDGTICWWKSKMPDPKANRLQWAPNDAILHYFEQLAQAPEKADTRFVLALLMIRRRIVRLENNEIDDQGRQIMVLYCPRNEKEYRVSEVHPTEARVEEIKEELAQLLFAGEG